jgi:hypothetical protein
MAGDKADEETLFGALLSSSDDDDDDNDRDAPPPTKRVKIENTNADHSNPGHSEFQEALTLMESSGTCIYIH